MIIIKKNILLLAFTLCIFSCEKSDTSVNPSPDPEPSTDAWVSNYTPGSIDNAGLYAGGNEIMQIVAHKGKLYAGNSYWTEPDLNLRSAEILRLDNSSAKWQVDKELSVENLRVGVMKSFIFNTNYLGDSVSPDTLLISIPNNNAGNVIQYVRNDVNNTWISATIANVGNDINCRAIGLHKDAINNKTFLFAGLMNYGIFSGTYNKQLPGKIQWNTTPEFIAPLNERVMGFTVCNNIIYCATSDGGIGHIYKRSDGTGTWTLVKTLSGAGESEDLRGLSAVPDPGGNGQVLWFYWNSNAIRVDPRNGYQQTTEYNLTAGLSSLLGLPIKYVLAAYNDNISIFNPNNSLDDIRIIGFEMRYDPAAITSNALSNIDRWSTNGMYFERHQNGMNISYTLKYIVNNAKSVKDTLVAARTFCISPFNEDNGKAMYAGGFDCNGIAFSKAAWIYRGKF